MLFCLRLDLPSRLFPSGFTAVILYVDCFGFGEG